VRQFTYGSAAFREGLRANAHSAGELELLGSLAGPGMRVLDIGAHSGVSTVALAGQVGANGHVYAFEPVPEYYAGLLSNLSHNRVENASAYMLAVTDRRGRTKFYEHGEGSGITPASDATEITVETTTVPEFLAEHGVEGIDLISMDCEGSELLALRGAEAFLRKQAPRILCEVHHGYLEQLGQSAGDVAGFLTDCGYDVRPVKVEDPQAKPGVGECSHLCAWGERGNRHEATAGALAGGEQ